MSFSAVILNSKEQRLAYLIGFLGILIGCIGIVYEFYYVALLPFAIGALFLCFFKPEFYTLLICFFVPLSVFVDDVGGGLGLSIPTEPMIWVLFVMLAFKFIISGQINKKFVTMPLVAFILLNFAWMVLATFASSMWFVSVKYMLARLWFMSVFFFFLFHVFQNPNFIRKYLSYMLYGTFIVVSFTLFKHAGEGFSRGWGYAIMKPFFGDHTIYSAYISFFVPIALVFAMRGNWFNFSVFQRIIFAGIALILVVGIVFSFTRASWISLIAAAAFYFLIKLKIQFKQILFVLGLIAFVAFIKQDQILYSLESNKQGSADDLESHAQSVSNITTDPSNLERLNRWQCAYLMFKERPVFGFGPGTYTFKYAPFQRPENLTLISTHSGDLGNTHNEYLNALSEMGLIGFISWFGVFLASIYTGMQIVYDKSKELWKRSLAKAVLLGLITYYIHAFLNNFSDFDKIAVPLWGFMAVLAALKFYTSKDSRQEESPKEFESVSQD
ncbi:MAG: O-antigen ligase family protein [Bacteroidia bacterium]